MLVRNENGEAAPLTRAELKDLFMEVLNEWPFLPMETHQAHHEWVTARIEREKAVRDLCWKLTQRVAEWSVLGFLAHVAGLLDGSVSWVRGHWPW